MIAPVHFELRTQVGGEWATVPFSLHPSVVRDPKVSALMIRQAYDALLRFVDEKAEAA